MTAPEVRPAATAAAAPLEPRHPAVVAFVVFLLAALALCWPMLAGRFLVSPQSDQYVAGYAFRLFGAEYFRAHGSIPEWNPYLFGGLPFIAAQHGDIFYPTAWLRWFLPVDTAMNLGFAAHLVIAGCAMYALLRALRLGWAGSVVGGLAYELTGIVASLVKPGHDGKLFVSALAPLALLALLRAVRERRTAWYGILALVVGLCLLSPHYQMTYYLLVACGIWTVWLALLDPERPANRPWWRPVAAALGAVLLGVAIAAIQIVPFYQYIPYSPRAAGGPSGGWEYATSYAMPPEEIVTTVLPQFNGVLQGYWGRNFFKLHTEYLGAVVVLLAAFGWGERKRRPLLLVSGAIALLFLLVAFGGHTPFYWVWYEVMPMMKKVRAPGMAFFLVALPVAVWAGVGAERLLRGEVSPTALWTGVGILGGFALLGAVGGLEPVATVLAQPDALDRVAANGPALRAGALRLLVFVAVGAAVLVAITRGRLQGLPAVTALAVVLAADLWSIDRIFFDFGPPASYLYRLDAITAEIKRERPPFRVLDPGVYPGSFLMAEDIQSVLGHHGNEVRFYDELLGGKNVWSNIGNPAIVDLVAARFIVLPKNDSLPGYRRVVAAEETAAGTPAVLFERDSGAAYARVLPAAAKVSEDQIVPTVLDARFPYQRIALYPDTASLQPAAIRPNEAVAPAATTPSIAEWEPGRMRITLAGADTRPTYLLVSETWYPDWHATVDGKPVPVHRGDYAFLSVVLPPGAKEVGLEFASGAYRRGQLVSVLALLATAALLAGPLVARRRANA
ncbi:MAG TPA: hypothetical protein VFK09_02015 [Gemmatimonadales bacterium]|nr:hypothetical protein [Gemmatimonadales bacterium]